MRLWAVNLALAGALLAQDAGKSLPSLRTTIGPGASTGETKRAISRISGPKVEEDQLRAADVRMGARLIEGAPAERNVARGLELLERAGAAKYMPALLYLGGLYELGTDDVTINN